MSYPARAERLGKYDIYMYAVWSYLHICMCMYANMHIYQPAVSLFKTYPNNILPATTHIVIFLDNTCVTKHQRLVYCRWRWQAFSLNTFTYAYRADNAKRIASIGSDNILFQDVIQPQSKRENYDTDFRTSRKLRLEMHNLEYKLIYYQPPTK